VSKLCSAQLLWGRGERLAVRRITVGGVGAEIKTDVNANLRSLASGKPNRPKGGTKKKVRPVPAGILGGTVRRSPTGVSSGPAHNSAGEGSVKRDLETSVKSEGGTENSVLLYRKSILWARKGEISRWGGRVDGGNLASTCVHAGSWCRGRAKSP